MTPSHQPGPHNSISHKSSSTLQALHRAGVLTGIDHQPTEAGDAYFAAPKEKMNSTPQKIYPINAAAQMLGISRSTAYRLIRDKKLVMVKISTRASGITAESLALHLGAKPIQNAG